MTKEEFWDLIASNYPKLSGSRGFEILRCVANSRVLESVSHNIAH